MKRLLFLTSLGLLISSLDCMDWITKPKKNKKEQKSEAAIKTHTYSNVFAKTSDNVLTTIPIWKIDQITLLQERLDEQKGTNSEENPINISDIKIISYYTDEETNTIKKKIIPITASMLKNTLAAFDHTFTTDEFSHFFKALGNKIVEGHTTNVDQKNLINAADAIGAERISLLIMQNEYPTELYDIIHKTKYKTKDATTTIGNYIISVTHYLKGPKKNILKGHTNKIRCVACSPQGDYIVSGSADKTLILWDAYTGAEKKIFKGHEKGVRCVAYSPCGNYIVSGSSDNNLIIWNTNTGDQEKILKGNDSPVSSVIYSPDGSNIISGSVNGNLIMWDVADGNQKEKVTLPASKNTDNMIYSMAYTPNKKSIAIDSTFGLFIYRVEPSSKEGKFISKESHLTKNSVFCFAYQPYGKFITFPHYNKKTETFNILIGHDLSKHYEVEILDGSKYSNDNINCIAYSPDGNYLVSGIGSTIILQNFITKDKNEKIKKFEEHTGKVKCIAYSPNGNYFVSGSDDKTLILQPMFEKTEHDKAVNCARIFEENLKSTTEECFIYRLYKATVKGISVIIDSQQDPDYKVYKSLPETIKGCIDKYFPCIILQ